MQWSYIDPNGRLNLDSIKDQQDWWAAQGEVPTKVPVERLVDMSFIEHAIKVLGEWKEPHVHR